LAKYHVGVDVGKNRHHISIRDLPGDTYYKTFSINSERQGFLEFVSALDKISTNKDDFLIGVEACGPYSTTLSYFLLSLGYELVEVNPF
jgi:transposase